MSKNVQFEEGQGLSYSSTPSRKRSVLIRIAMKFGAKNEKQANILLFVVAIVFFIVSGVLFARLMGMQVPLIDSNRTDTSTLSPVEKRILEQGQRR